jgi:hypothetical protein
LRILSLVFLVLGLAPVLCAQRGLEPKAKASDYPASARGASVEIGAEYLVRMLQSGEDSFFIPDFLVVQVAVYPLGVEPVRISSDQFSLRINRKKQVLVAQPPGFVAASLKYPGWNSRPRLETGASIGNTGVILGRPAPVERFPGDPSARRRIPEPPKIGQTPQQAGKEPRQTADQAAVERALPDTKLEHPVSGYLYFAYQGKTKSIKSLELIFRDGEKTVSLKLL